MPDFDLNILGAARVANVATMAALRPFGYTIKSSGTGALPLAVAISTTTGYWASPTTVSSKPPRWITHLELLNGSLSSGLATDGSGAELKAAGTPGYINNGPGDCTVVAVRLMPAVKRAHQLFEFPADWEWIVQFAFANPLPSGTSGDALTDFDVAASTIKYKGRASDYTTYEVARLFLITTLTPNLPEVTLPGGETFTYSDATQSILSWLSRGIAPADVYDPAVISERDRITTDVKSAVTPRTPPIAAPPSVVPSPELIGIPNETYDLINAALSDGKRNFIFHGPPGTGKTTLAQYVAEQIVDTIDPDGGTGYSLLTASSSWSSQDLVGGYQPVGKGRIAFIPGPLLREFDRPMIIDEMNRAPIDKVLGPLFSVLSGQPTTLPYRVNVADPASENYKILPISGTVQHDHEFAPGLAWALICTLNEVDKSQLEPLSFALARRFLWIRVGVPEDLRGFVVSALESKGLRKPSTVPLNPVADLWRLVNGLRELGPAPILDFIELAAQMDSSIDFEASPSASNAPVFIQVLGATLIPLLDGITKSEATQFASDLSSAWNLTDLEHADLARRVSGVAL